MSKRMIGTGIATAGVVLAMAAPAMAATTLGQLAPDNATAQCLVGPFDIVTPSPTSGAPYVSPETGTITSWSTNARMGAGQTQGLKIFRKVSDPNVYQAVGHDGPRNLTASSVNTFQVSIP